MSRLPKKLIGAILVTVLVGVSFVDETAATSHDCSNGTAVPNPSQNPGLVADCDALISGKDTLDPDDELDWDDQRLINNWDGVTVTGTPQRVTELDLVDNDELNGSIPPELGDLSSLNMLDVSGNNLSGTIPPELGNLSSLEELYLFGNTLSGMIPPELGDLSSLKVLVLFGNALSGTIPPELGDLSNLEELYLFGNTLSGTIPPELGDLSSLEWLVLFGNSLSGTIPAELGDLSELYRLSLNCNLLTGTIPSELGDAGALDELHIGGNRLTPPLPSSLADVTVDTTDDDCGSAFNSAPTFTDTDPTSRSIAENSMASSTVGTAMSATDSHSDAIAYSISGTDAALFTINATSGQIMASAALDFETDDSYSVTVEAADPYGASSTIGVTISVTDVTETPGQPSAPTLTPGYLELSVSWSTPSNTGPAITDYDVRYMRTSDSSWSDHAFIGTTTSTLITGLDRATGYDVQVRATNDEGTGYWSTSTTATTSANRLPSFTDGATTTRSVAESAESGQNIGGVISATDADGDTLTYTVSGTDAASFTIDSTSGQLKTSAPLDYETDDSYSVTVEVSDGYGGTDTIAVTISVTHVPDVPGRPSAPTLTPGYFELNVSWSPPANPGPVITDYDVRYMRTVDSSWSDHAFTGTATSTRITGLGRSTGYQVQVRAINDEGTGAWSTSTTATTSPNRAPSFTIALSVAENTPSGQNIGEAFGATDADGDALTYSISGTDAASFTIESTSGQLKTSAVLDYETAGSYSFMVEVADAHGGRSSIGVIITVTDVT